MNTTARHSLLTRIYSVILALLIIAAFSPVSNATYTDKISSQFTGSYQYGTSSQKISIKTETVTFSNVTCITYYDKEQEGYRYPKGTWDVVKFTSHGEQGDHIYYNVKLKDQKNGHHIMNIQLHYSAVKSKRHVSNSTRPNTGACFYMKKKY